MKINKNTLVPSIIAVVSLFALVIGATYAYYTVQKIDNSKTTTLGASLQEIGSVAIASGQNLSLNLTRPGMMQTADDKIYYATPDGNPVENQPSAPNIGIATVTGNGNFICDYTLHVAMTGDLYTAFKNMSTKSSGQAILTINGTDYDFYNSNNFTSGAFDINGTLTDLNATTQKYITAQFRIINKASVDQSNFNGKSVTFKFTITSFSCVIK